MEVVKRIKNLEHIKLAAVYIGLSVLDIVLTQMTLNNGGYEINPVMQYFLRQSYWIAWGIKLGVTIGISLILIWCATMRPRLTKIAFISLVAFMVVVCLYNGIGLLS